MKGNTVPEMIDAIVEGVGYEHHLQSTHGPDAETRMENVNELKVSIRAFSVAVLAFP